MEIIDKNIFKRFKESDHKAFDSIFLSYYDRIRNFINGLIKSEEDAEELAQDIFVKLWMNRNTIDLNRSFDSYLFTIARNTTYNYLKHQLVHQSYVTDYLKNNSDYGNEIEETIFAKEINLLIEMTVDKMPSRRKDIFIYSRIKGYSNDEIAERLNISKKTVENQLSIALAELRKIIQIFIFLMACQL